MRTLKKALNFVGWFIFSNKFRSIWWNFGFKPAVYGLAVVVGGCVGSALSGCATAKPVKNNCPVAVIEVRPVR